MNAGVAEAGKAMIKLANNPAALIAMTGDCFDI
jgi:hypothetical protein